jgi:hypothetical protein
MEIIERYIQAVGYWLPKNQRADILAELTEDIRSEVDARETEFGRRMNDDEYAAMLRRRGSPFLVARRYLPERHLIGPVLFPIFSLVLKVYALVFIAPWLLLWLTEIISSPTYRADHPIEKLQSLWLGSMYMFAFTTLGFAIVEKFKIGFKSWENWDPRRLPRRTDTNRIARSSTLFDFAAGFAVVLWLLIVLQFRTEFTFAGARITLTPEWRYIAGTLLVSAAVTIALSVANCFRPWWTKLRAGIRLANDAVASALFCLFLKSAIVGRIVVPNLSDERALSLAHGLNAWMANVMPIFAVFGIGIVALDARRMLRLSKPEP